MYLTFSVYPIIQNNIFGIFTLYIPLAIVMSVVYHALVRDVLIRHLPMPFDSRYAGFLTFDFLGYLRKNFWVYLLSVFIGVAVHLGLDNLTHETTTFTKAYPGVISSDISVSSSFSIKIYALLQILFSAFGLGYLILFMLTLNKPLPVYKPAVKADKLLYYYLLFAFFTGIVFIRFLFPWPNGFFTDLVIISIMSSAMLALLLASAVIFAKNTITK